MKTEDAISLNSENHARNVVLDKEADPKFRHNALVLFSAITRQTLPQIMDALGGSRGTDVTGGMAGKVTSKLDLVNAWDSVNA